ncbi:site-specific recombinase resolvase, partial [Ralstonia pseudosolanacearum]
PTAVNELMRLTLLAPDIIAQLLAGRQPRSMTLWWFQHSPLPVDWDAQRQLVARFEEKT